MATQTVFTATNLHSPSSPPSFFVPSAAGAPVPAGGVSWILSVTSSLYAAGSSADLTIEYEYNGVWQADSGVGGFTLGTYVGKQGSTSTNTLSSSIGVNATPYPSNVRLRIDRIPAGTIDSLNVTVS